GEESERAPGSERVVSGGMGGKVVVITGSNVGIGKETAVGLAAMGATTVLACRNRAKADAAAAEVKERAASDDVHVVDLDLGNSSSIKAAAADVLGRWDRLDVLVNNAGGIWSERTLTADGFEQTFGVNHLGPFLFTSLLLDRLKASAPSRIVNLSSVGHHFAFGGLDWADLQSEHGYSAMDVYGKSKLANVLFTRELARRLDGTGVTANAVHPGPVRSGFGMDGDMAGLMGLSMKLVRPFEISPVTGARTSIKLASAPELAGHTGEYWARGRKGHLSKNGADAAAAARLWDESEKLWAGVATG
ncbi:MAG TPA: SDR family oxidoreductase, partial [Acidimicrobiales bacterium]